MLMRFFIRLAAAAALCAVAAAVLLSRQGCLAPLGLLRGTGELLCLGYFLGLLGNVFWQALSRLGQLTLMGIVMKSLPGLVLLYLLLRLAAVAVVPVGVLQILRCGIRAGAMDRLDSEDYDG